MGIEKRKKIRIWYQGFTDPAVHSAYVKRLQAHLDEIAGLNVSIVFKGISPPASHLHPIEEMRCGLKAIENAIEAEEQNYDGFAMGHFQEAGIHEIKSLLNIPVLSLGEATLLYSCSLGRKLGLITIDPIFVSWHEEQITKVGLSDRVVGVKAMKTSPKSYMDAFSNKEACKAIIKQFNEQAQQLLESGADVLIPAGGLPMLLLAQNDVSIIDKAPVVNGINVLVKFLEASIYLKQIDGLGISRRSNYKLPSSDALSEFKNILGG